MAAVFADGSVTYGDETGTAPGNFLIEVVFALVQNAVFVAVNGESYRRKAKTVFDDFLTDLDGENKY